MAKKVTDGSTHLHRLIDLKHDKLKPIKVDRSTIKYATATANGLTRAVVDFLTLSGHQAERINTMGVWMKSKGYRDGGFYRPTTGTKGSADISAIVAGKSVKIEVKINDQLSDAQIRYGEQVTRAGGIYLVVRTFDQFIEWYDQFVQG